MNNPEYNIPPTCRDCENKKFPYIEDNTQVVLDVDERRQALVPIQHVSEARPSP